MLVKTNLSSNVIRHFLCTSTQWTTFFFFQQWIFDHVCIERFPFRFFWQLSEISKQWKINVCPLEKSEIGIYVQFIYNSNVLTNNFLKIRKYTSHSYLRWVWSCFQFYRQFTFNSFFFRHTQTENKWWNKDATK